MLTPTQVFEDIILTKTAQELVPFLLTLDKKEAIAVRPHIQRLKKDLEEYRKVDKPNGQSEYSNRITMEQQTMLALTGIATFTRKEAFGRGFDLPYSFRNEKDNRHHYQLFTQVLHHFRPDWFGELQTRIMRSNPWQALDYWQMRELETTGIISYDPWTFAMCVAQILNRYNWQHNSNKKGFDQKILNELQDNSILLSRDLPLIFDFETGVDSDGTWTGRESERTVITWLTLLPPLAESGHLDRADLLTRSLLALRRDFRRGLLIWFKNVFLALKPTMAERLARQTELVELLAHPLALVVNFALDQLKDLWAEPEFDPTPLLQYADGLMTRQDLKTALRTLLSAFEKLLKRSPELAPTLTRLAASALANADSTVQARAAKLVATVLGAKKPLLSTEETAEIIDSVATYADLLAAGTRDLLTTWLPDTDPATTELSADYQSLTYAPLAAFVPDVSPATAIAPVADWHELLFLTGPVLQGQNPAGMERWIDGLLRLREQFPAGYTQQLLPYLKQHLPWGLKGKTEEETATALYNYTGFGNHRGQSDLLLALLISWLLAFEHSQVGQINLHESQYYSPDPLLLLEQRRLAAAENQLRDGAAHLPLLSTPSHAPHWVAPTALVTKLLAYQNTAQQPDPADLTVALARCAWQAEPDAAAARALLPQLASNDLRELLTWLLAPAEPAPPAAATIEVTATTPAAPIERIEHSGNHEVTICTTELTPVPVPVPLPAPAHTATLPLLVAPVERTANYQKQTLLQRAKAHLSKLIPIKADAPAAPVPIALAEALPWLWAVAARTRYPQAELPSLSQLADFPGLARPWQPGWTFSEQSRTYIAHWQRERPTVTHSSTHLYVPTEPAAAPPSPLLLYSAHARLSQSKGQSVWLMQTNLAYGLALLPHNPEPLHWHVLREACRIDDQGSEAREVLLVVLQQLLEPGPHFAAGTSALLAVALVYSAPVCRALALEVLLSAIATARLVPADLGRALGRLLAAERAPAQRLADALAQTRAIGPATDDALRQMLEHLLPELPAAPIRNTAKLLDAYANARGRQPVPTAVQTRLREWQAASASLKKPIGLLLAGA